MSTQITKGKLFVQEVVARLKGDDAEAIGAKVARKGISAVEGQIAALKGLIVDQENALDDAKEVLGNATFPTALFIDSKLYCQTIVAAQEKVDAAQEKLDATNKSITFFEEVLAKF